MKPLPKRSLITVGVVVAGLVAIHEWQVRPHVNPNPVKRVVVRGVFPYAQGWELRMWQHFYSNNPECKYTGRAFFIFPTAEVPRTADIAVPLKRVDDQRYEAEYFEDYYLPGRCDWSPADLFAEASANGASSVSRSLMGSQEHRKVDFDCSTYRTTFSGRAQVSVTCLRTHDFSGPGQQISEVNFHYKGEQK